MGESCQSVSQSVNMRLVVLLISALVSLTSTQLCLDEMEVAAACVAHNTGLSHRLMSAINHCETSYGSGYGSGYDSGYGSGYSGYSGYGSDYSGYGSGYDSGYGSYDSGYGSGYSGYSGYGSGYDSGYGSGYDSGYGSYGSSYDSGYGSYGSGYDSGYGSYGSGYGSGYGGYGRKAERKLAGDDHWNTFLGRQMNCSSASQILVDFHNYMTHDLCIWEGLGWYNFSSIGWIDFSRYQLDIDSLAPSVSSELSWDGRMGECWRNSTRPFYAYFADCDHSSEDWTTVTNIISAWGDMTCFNSIFQEACTSLIRTEIHNYSFNSGPYNG